jgi:NhaP-type Na+/H+ or K+/H+ antiporter
VHPAASPTFTFALALAAGVAAQLVARHLQLPSIVLLLAVGVALGPDGAGLVQPDTLGHGLFSLVSLAVAVILFEGGLSLDLARLRRAARPVRLLVTVGALVTTAGGALAARWAMDWPWSLALLYGTLVIVTGPTVIRPLLRYVPLRPRLATVLEAEGLLIDPVGAIVAAVCLQVVVAPSLDTFATGAIGLLARLSFGAGMGLVFGWALAAVLRHPHAAPEGLENLVALGGALLTFAVCEQVLSESGILAVTVAGVVVGNRATRVRENLGEFQEHLTVGLLGILFVLLAADVRVAEVLRLGVPGLLTVALLAIAVRPLGVWLSTIGSQLDLREKLFLSGIAPRGVVAAAVASLTGAVLAEVGVAGGEQIRALVFLTIGLTVVVQGGTAPLLARALGVRAPGRTGVVILGAEELGFALGEVLAETSEGGVVFSDSNPLHCRAAEQRGHRVVFGNALDEPVLARMRLERARAAVALTSNDQVNGHFAREALDRFDVPSTYVAVDRKEAAVTARIAERAGIRALFDGPKDIERWNVRLRHAQASVRRFRFAAPPASAADAPKLARETEPQAAGLVDPYLVLAVRRGGAPWSPMSHDYEPRPDDLAAVAVHQAEEALALESLRQAGWSPAPAEPAAPAASDRRPALSDRG